MVNAIEKEVLYSIDNDGSIVIKSGGSGSKCIDKTENIGLFFRKICSSYEMGSNLYIDLGYNPDQLSMMTLYSTLVYAEKVLKCRVCEILLGGQSVRALYENQELIRVAGMRDLIDEDELLNMLS